MADDLVFDPGMKKKKKKTKVLDVEGEGSAPAEGQDEGTNENAPVADLTQEPALDFGKKKKKTKKPKPVLPEDKADGGNENEVKSCTDPSWKPHTYDDLLARVYNIMRERNPDGLAGERRKFVMKPPNCLRVGSKKTAFANFAEICQMLKRQPKHLLQFLLAELGTSGSVDGNNQLIVKGRFQQKHIESVLRSYIKEYVTCKTCKSPETSLEKNERLFFLQCSNCGSRASVATIKTGFQAQVIKRTRQRAAAGQ